MKITKPILPDGRFKDTPPPEKEVIIVKRKADGKLEQVEIQNAIAYAWRYKLTDEIFCKAEDVVCWRGCGGFDF